jgi:hypothetical protein
MTYKEIVSSITNILKLNNKDDRMSRRFILKSLKDSANFLISQKLGERSLSLETNLFTNIPCFEFTKIEAKKCPSIEFRRCGILMKSKKPLPKLIFSRLGSSIREITSLDGDFRFTIVDEIQYRRNKKRQHSLKNEVYVFLGTDNHLYIPDHEILSLDLTVLTAEVDDAEEASGCFEKGNCRNKFENKFICPDKLIEAVKDMTLQRLGITKQINEDQNPNSQDNR